MSQAVAIQEHVYAVEKDFNLVNSYKLNFVKEAQFALQLLDNNDFLKKVATSNPLSLEYALINLASIGLSLNPALKECYLVPRDGKICLDPSYMGLIKLATDTGSIIWAQAEIVKKNDEFTYNGIGNAPTHKMNPFGDRGEMIGSYCVAKVSSGDLLSTMMSIKEIEEIRYKSSKAAKNGPWVTFFEEMSKKTVLKRASKLWPKSERLDTAIEVLNQYEGIEFNDQKGAFVNPPSPGLVPSEKVFQNIRDMLNFNKKTETGLLLYLNKKFKVDLQSIEEMDAFHIEEAYRVMGGSK